MCPALIRLWKWTNFPHSQPHHYAPLPSRVFWLFVPERTPNLLTHFRSYRPCNTDTENCQRKYTSSVSHLGNFCSLCSSQSWAAFSPKPPTSLPLNRTLPSLTPTLIQVSFILHIFDLHLLQVFVFFTSSWFWWVEGNGEELEKDDAVPVFKEFGLAELRAATNGFSSELIVSESGEKAPNVVYRGKLRNNRLVAIKRFSKLSWPDPHQFVVHSFLCCVFIWVFSPWSLCFGFQLLLFGILL